MSRNGRGDHRLQRDESKKAVVEAAKGVLLKTPVLGFPALSTNAAGGLHQR
jgi:hypothetical protein